MSILIKGVKMPSCCEKCLLNYDYYRCNALGDRFDDREEIDFETQRLSDCPLVEIPEPHGRLIDADFEESHYESMIIAPTPDVTEQDKLYAGRIATALRMAKTVIEREAEE